MTINPDLQKAFRFHLQTIPTRRGIFEYPEGKANWAILLARRDVAECKRRYPSRIKPYSAVSWLEPERVGNLPFPQYQKAGKAYVENPAAVGLRLVGEVSIEFRRGPFNRNSAEGWLTDPYGDVFKDGSGLAWGEVYQLPGKNGESRFVAGYRFGGCDGGPTLDLGTIYTEPRGDWEMNPTECDAARDAARAADSMAQSAAEKEREYQTAWQAGSQWASEAETVATSRAELKALLSERRKVKGTEGFPTLCGAIKAQASRLIRNAQKARERMAELANGDSPDLHFWTGEERLQQAFCEGAGLQAFPS